MNKQEIYKKNQKRIKILGIITPIVFWLCIALAILCFCLAISNSIENVNEIYNMLDSAQFKDEEIAYNYSYLCDKYGEWVIGKGGSGFTLVFVNFKNAVFNAFIVTNGIFAFVFFISAFILGKWVLPALKKKLEQDNQDMVNLTILEDK